MKTSLVVDSSVVFKWFNQAEIYRDQALRLLEDYLSQRLVLTAPDLLVYEVANAWATKSALSLQEVTTNLKKLEKVKLNLEQLNPELIKKAVVLSKKFGISVYDASYAVLAKEKKCTLITADEKLVKQLNLPFVESLSEYKPI